METNLLYLIMAGWIVMLFLPTILPAFAAACAFGLASAIMVFASTGGMSVEGDIFRVFLRVAPLFTIAVFVAWPFGAALRWMLRRDPSM